MSELEKDVKDFLTPMVFRGEKDPPRCRWRRQIATISSASLR
jgi:hypothetical protein